MGAWIRYRIQFPEADAEDEEAGVLVWVFQGDGVHQAWQATLARDRAGTVVCTVLVESNLGRDTPEPGSGRTASISQDGSGRLLREVPWERSESAL